MGIKQEVSDLTDVQNAERVDTGAQIRRRVIDRVIDAGGEVLAVTVEHGAVRLHVRIGMREDVPLIGHLLREIDGVASVEAWFEVGGERGSERKSAKPVTLAHCSGPARE